MLTLINASILVSRLRVEVSPSAWKKNWPGARTVSKADWAPKTCLGFKSSFFLKVFQRLQRELPSAPAVKARREDLLGEQNR